MSWVTIAFTTLGGGAIGSVITTYGTQTKDRRTARAQARESLRKVERAARALPGMPPQVANAGHVAVTTALDDLDTSAMLAGIPRSLVRLNRDATMRHWVRTTSAPSFDEMIKDSEYIVAGRVMHQSAALLATATWRPWQGAPYRAWRTWRTWRLNAILRAGMPGRTALDEQSRHNLRKWEREVLRTPKVPIADQPNYEIIRQALRECD